MHYEHSIEQAAAYSKSAHDRLKKEKLAATPHAYEVWYVYYSGQSPELTKAIDGIVAARQKFDDSRCEDLYVRFLSVSQDEEAVRRAGEQINNTIRNVSGTVREVKYATNAYTNKLGSLSSRISAVKDARELNEIVSSVMTDTQDMLNQNQKLEEELTRSSEAMEQLQRDLEAVRREAMTDGLTGLSNRKSFDSDLRRISDEAIATGTIFSLLMLDIDHFKSFNDNYGHQIGDQVLRLVARTLTDGVKGRDVAARYGGEEFAIILPDTPLNAGVTVGNALRRALANKDVINRNTGEKLGRITMSVGVAEYNVGEPLQELIERADAALYTAKHNGRNQVASAPTPGKKQKREAS